LNPGCPACGTATQPDRWDDVQGFECPACQAHVIRAEQLEQFLSRQQGPRRFTELMQRVREAPASQRDLTCPDCRTRTYRVLRSGLVEIESCATCIGLFLDAGEAMIYLRQIRYRVTGEKVVDSAASTVDGLGALAEFLSFFFHH
jgi:Zn-finger nucleic acid-binding protein